MVVKLRELDLMQPKTSEVVFHFGSTPEMIMGTRLWTDVLWVGGGSCDLGDVDSLGLLEAFLPGSRPLL